MLKILICDDDAAFARQTKSMTADYCREHNIRRQILVCHNGRELDNTQAALVDIAFLDVEMSGESGLNLAARIRENSKKALLIFISSYIEYATFGYEVEAFRYILKKDVEKLFFSCMEAAVEKMGRQSRFFPVKTDLGEEKIPLERIIYIATYGRKMMIKLTDGANRQFYSTMHRLEEELGKKGFIRLQRSFLVNMAHIKKIKSGIALLSDGEELTVSREKYREITAKYLAYRRRE